VIAIKRLDGGTGGPTSSTLETVLRRDRLVVTAALGAIVALSWGYLLWLAADMSMGGMDMTGFRMSPAGIGLMAPAKAPWSAIEFAFVFVMWVIMMVGMMTPSAAPMILLYARMGRQAKAEGKPLAANRLVCRRLSSGLGRLFSGRDPRAMVDRTGGIARFPDGDLQHRAGRRSADSGWPLPMDPAQGRVSCPMPDPVSIPDAPRWISRRCVGLPAARASPRKLLLGLLLGLDDTLVCGWGDECALDRTPGAIGLCREIDALRTVGRTGRWRRVHRGRHVDVESLCIGPRAVNTEAYSFGIAQSYSSRGDEAWRWALCANSCMLIDLLLRRNTAAGFHPSAITPVTANQTSKAGINGYGQCTGITAGNDGIAGNEMDVADGDGAGR
jgi:hypothetical protein